MNPLLVGITDRSDAVRAVVSKIAEGDRSPDMLSAARSLSISSVARLDGAVSVPATLSYLVHLRKQQIRAAATRCFVRRGFAATRLLDIAREAGLSKGGVYFHYRAKEALFHDILEAQFAALQDRWDAQQDTDQPADRALRALVLTHVQTLEQSPDEARFCNLMIAMASQNPEFREKFEHSLTMMRTRYVDLVLRGGFTGDPVVLARGIIALIYGVAAQSAADGQAILPLTAEQVADLAIRLAGAPA